MSGDMADFTNDCWEDAMTPDSFWEWWREESQIDGQMFRNLARQKKKKEYLSLPVRFVNSKKEAG